MWLPTRYPARVGTQATGRDHSIWEIILITFSWGILKICCLYSDCRVECRQCSWVASLLLGCFSVARSIVFANLNLNGRGESWELNTESFWLVVAGRGRREGGGGSDGGEGELLWAAAAAQEGKLKLLVLKLLWSAAGLLQLDSNSGDTI